MSKSPKAISYYALVDFHNGIGILKVTARRGKIIEKGPIIRLCKDRREAGVVVRGMNYGGKAA